MIFGWFHSLKSILITPASTSWNKASWKYFLLYDNRLPRYVFCNPKESQKVCVITSHTYALRRYLNILWNIHESLMYKRFTRSNLQVVQNSVTLIFYNLAWSIHIFTPDRVNSLCFLSTCCSPGWYRYLYKPSSSNTYPLGYFSGISCLTLSSLIASFGFIPFINDFVLFILWAVLFRLPILFRDLGVLESIHQLKQLFSQLFVKGFWKSCKSVLTFCWCSLNFSIVFFKQLCHINSKLRPFNTLKYLWVFKYTTQYKCNLTYFLGLKEISLYCILWSINTC